MMADPERYTIYSEAAKRLSVSIVNKTFSMEGYGDIRWAHFNKNILPFKDYLGFDVLKSADGKDTHMNVSYSGLQRLIHKVKPELKNHVDCCLAVSISSHGKIEEKDGKISHFLLCSKPKDDDQEKTERWFCTNELVMQFREFFKGPMIVFIQACRGEQDDIGTSVFVHQIEQQVPQAQDPESGIGSMTLTDEDRYRSESDSVTNQGSGAESSLPASGDTSANSTSTTMDDDQLSHEFAPMCPPDCVVAFASAHEYTSKCSNKTGGWLLHSFNSAVEELEENGELSILSLLTKANNPVSGMAGMEGQREEGEKCIGSFQHKLVKELILKRVAKERDDADDEVENL
ncbi:uncharacterized protein LOC110445574 [Mizuhopecten yessoensis]|uniref:Caspase family p20 domain-containing protein n=1 Tax=Mizuhopecten yessoensis TaxID=6573 RepID=A0A210QYZ6_MIZYE|nr:uncharacterized protein LOC110445574 [Mizuhopecten yessoensis]OWF53954.1 hypothetical protein KP79_PYT15364 [Mizuhopecten yessoensis]